VKKPVLETQPLNPAIAAAPALKSNTTAMNRLSRLPVFRIRPAKGNSNSASENGAIREARFPPG